MGKNEPKQESLYQIRVREILNSGTTDWFGSLTIAPLEDGGTLLTGAFADQSALRGFVDQLWNLNLTVLAVEKVGYESQSDSLIMRKDKSDEHI